MAISLAGSKWHTSGDGSVKSIDYTYHAGTNRILLVFTNSKSSSSSYKVTAVTAGYSAEYVGMTEIANFVHSGTTYDMSAWYLLDTDFPESEETILITIAGSQILEAIVIELHGVDQTAPDAEDHDSTTEASITSTVSTIIDNSWIVGYCGTTREGNNTTSIAAPPDGQTVPDPVDAGYFTYNSSLDRTLCNRWGYKLIPTAGSEDMTWSLGTLTGAGQILIALAPFVEVLPSSNSAILAATF
jgi:hypothetical protein